MNPDEWIEVFQQIKRGEYDFVHETFPQPLILGMKITRLGVQMMIVKQNEENYTYVEFYNKEASSRHKEVEHFANKHDPMRTLTIAPEFPREPPTIQKDVTGLFKKRRKIKK